MCSHFSLVIGYACRVLKMGKQGGKCNSEQPTITLSLLLLHINALYTSILRHGDCMISAIIVSLCLQVGTYTHESYHKPLYGRLLAVHRRYSYPMRLINVQYLNKTLLYFHLKSNCKLSRLKTSASRVFLLYQIL